MLRNIAGP